MEKMYMHDFDENTTGVDEDSYFENPMVCGHCHYSGHQIVLYALETPADENYSGVAFTMCSLCQESTVHFLSQERGVYYSDNAIPSITKEIKLSEYISNTFPSFTAIYNQASIAESDELDLIAGMGYRKSVEFLVSDYLLKFQSNDKDITEEWVSNPKTSLSQKINKIENDDIKTLSRAITWIGNDETHYTRRNPEYDINKMKAFINALLGLIDFNQSIAEAKKFTGE